MSIQLLIPGRPSSTVLSPETVHRGPTTIQQGAHTIETHLLDAVEILGTFDVTPSARAAQLAPSVQPAQQDDIIEFSLDSGVSIWTSVAAYQKQQQRASRSRGSSSTGLLIEPDLDSQTFNRGITSGLAASAVRILRLKPDEIWEDAKDPKNWPDWFLPHGFKTLEQVGAQFTAKLIIGLIEKKTFSKYPAGLHQWTKSRSFDETTLKKPEDISANKPILLFIHGTGSSTQGSFGALHSGEAASEWGMLTRTFGECIFAFEHPTLSVSPIDNALRLAQALPNDADLSIVSHSRGGQVADLLCLNNLSADVLNRYNRRNEDFQAADSYDRQQLAELAKVLKNKSFRIRRLIRVASPSQGTLLASENSDHFLSIITSLIGFIPLLGQSPLYQVIKRITLEAIKQRWNPTHIPGVEAMTPSSPLVALLNDPEVQAAGDLGVIAGDIEASNWFKRLGIFISDKFIYDSGDNDLVVNTASMFQGISRTETSRYLFDQGSDVSHFRYFDNARTRRLITQALSQLDSQWPIEFHSLEGKRAEPVPMLRSIQTRSGNQPVVFVLPGIMGSELKAGDKDVWLNYFRLLRGDLEKLTIDAPSVTVTGLVSSYYRKLCSFLADSHEVIPFGYDWRRSIKQAAVHLANEVERVANRTDQPIRFIVHSMGGLVVRRFIQDFPDLWERLCKRKGARVVMLGTPNHGSFDTIASLAGEAKTIRQLALLDCEHSLPEIVEIIAKFQGSLELLPHNQDWKYFTADQWKELSACAPSGVTLSVEALTNAKSAIADLTEDIPHADCIRYVAGQSSRTISGVRIEANELVFEATTAGDGRVTYESGRLSGVPMWYTNAEHGDLSCHSQAFDAYRELLERGETTLLSMSPPISRGVVETFDTVPEPVLYPTPESLEAGLLGRRTKQASLQPAHTLRISVRHGDLQHTRYPVMISHYERDTIAGPEKIADSLVGGALSERYRLGRYPGKSGTVAVVLAQQNQFQQNLNIQCGAIVLGLGRWGELTPTRLTQAVQQGALEYALHVAQCKVTKENQNSDGLTINSLLIGSNTSGNIAVEDSVNAIIRGVLLANRALLEKKEAVPHIAHIEFIELYLDAAVDAVKATQRLKTRIERELSAQLQVSPWLIKGQGCKSRLVSPSSSTYWRRWTISAVSQEPSTTVRQLPAVLQDRLRKALEQSEAPDPLLTETVMTMVYQQSAHAKVGSHQLRFLALSDRARAEATVQATQPELVGQLLKQITRDSVFASSLSKTLFELLIPLDLKNSLLNQDRIVLIVDAITANYPWELMSNDGQPLCARMGMIRQLELDNYDAYVRDTTSKSVYVLGNPATPPEYPSLENARIEADAIAALLKTKFTVTQTPNQANAIQVFNDLFAEPYRIIHIAAHGYYDESGLNTYSARSGVVLNGGIYITAAEIAKLDPIPELVFLNCCYLGQIDSTNSNQILGQPYNKLAASISRELIRRGVRAVIAAGWPVADEAAALFSQAFYRYLLEGQTFGIAVWLARRDTWEKFPNSNTWGAYQAYGDPDFRLSNVSNNHLAENDPLVSAEELLIKLDNLSELDDSDQFELAINNLSAQSSVEWYKQANIQERMAELYSNRGQFLRAKDFYLQAIQNESSENISTLRAVEQWINCLARSAHHKNDVNEQIKQLMEAIQYGESLLSLGKTSERFCIMGGIYKRLAEIAQDPQNIENYLSKASEYYHQGEKCQRKLSMPNPYAMLNAWTIDAIRGNSMEHAELMLERGKAMARRRFEENQNAWDMIMVADLSLIQSYLSGNLKDDIKSLTDTYLQAFLESGANARERDSANHNLSFMITMMKKLVLNKKADKETKTIIQSLEEIYKALNPTIHALEQPITSEATQKTAVTKKKTSETKNKA